jgi:hypothetical protein
VNRSISLALSSTLVAAAASLATLAAPTSALAQAESAVVAPAPSGPPAEPASGAMPLAPGPGTNTPIALATPVRNDSTRFRFGIGLWAAVGELGFGALGLGLRAGVQVNDLIGVYAQLQATTLILGAVAAASVMVDFTLHDLVTLGVGLGGGVNGAAVLFGGTSSAALFGVPLRAALNFGPSEPQRPSRHRFSVSLDALLGYGPLTSSDTTMGQPVNGFRYQFGLGLGYELM